MRERMGKKGWKKEMGKGPQRDAGVAMGSQAPLWLKEEKKGGGGKKRKKKNHEKNKKKKRGRT